MDKTESILCSFHPQFINIPWLEKRFKEFCSKKHDVDMKTIQLRLTHAPNHAKVVNKIFGRDSSTSKVLMYHDDKTFSEYLQLTSRKDVPQKLDYKGKIGQASVLMGAVSDMESLVVAVMYNTPLYVDVLTLFELVNMTYFCKTDYLHDTHPSRRWIVNYLCDIVSNVTSYTSSYDFSIDCQGLQTEKLLKEVRSTLLSCVPIKRMSTHIDVTERDKCSQTILDIPRPLSSTYLAHVSRLRGRTILGKNEQRYDALTTYTSPISNTIAKPMPETLLPACTGSIVTKMDVTDL